MNLKLPVLTTVITLAVASISTPACYAGTAKTKSTKAPAKQQQQLKQMTGLQTNVSVQILRCVRANVEEFGRNNVVVLQYRLKKEGPNSPGTMTKAWFEAVDVKARDPVLGSSYEVIRGKHEHNTYSNTAMTNEWTVGQTGDGYAWFKIPDDVKKLDIYFPETRAFNNVPIEVPKG